MADAGTTTAHIAAALVLIPIDPERARNLLLTHAQDRLERLASRALNGYRPIRERGVQTGDIVQTLNVRLITGWEKTVAGEDGQPIRDTAVFLRRVSFLLRSVLRDELRKVIGRPPREPGKRSATSGQDVTGEGREAGDGSPSGALAEGVAEPQMLPVKRRPKQLPLVAGDGELAHAHDPGSDTNDPAELAVFTEFHRTVDELPDDLQAVVDLRYYQGLEHAEVGELLGVAEVTARKKWLRARLKLIERLGTNPFDESEA